jgi:hypothetical protein
MAFRLSSILRSRPQIFRQGFRFPKAPREQKSTPPTESSERPMSDGEILRHFRQHGPPISELLLLSLQFDDETTDRLNKIRASIVPQDRTVAHLTTTYNGFSRMPVKHFDLYDKTFVDICSRTQPFSGGASFPKVYKIAGQPAVGLDFQSRTSQSLYRSMISEWKAKVSMPETLVSDLRLKPEICLQAHLSPLEAHIIVQKLTNEFPRGIELGFALGFSLHKRSPIPARFCWGSRPDTARPGGTVTGRELLKRYEFKGVGSIKPNKNLETYQKWLRLRFPHLVKDV